jgi:dephospho-CoA kinase
LRFILIGRAGSGKDTVADYLIEKYGFHRYSFAEKLKEVALDLFPVQFKKDRRNLLQQLGAKLREINEDVWVNYLLHTMPGNSITNIVITDCRYENEYDICTKDGFIAVKVNCDDRVRAERLYQRDGRRMTPAEQAHISERLNVPCDYHLNNNFAIESLYLQIDKMVQEVRDAGSKQIAP